MSLTRDDLVQRIVDERARQFDLPGREMDVANTPNDWVTVASAYLHDGATRNHMKPDLDEYQDALIKAAAVILAALEYCPYMEKKDHFRCSPSNQ
jgi:hypothetical protein